MSVILGFPRVSARGRSSSVETTSGLVVGALHQQSFRSMIQLGLEFIQYVLNVEDD